MHVFLQFFQFMRLLNFEFAHRLYFSIRNKIFIHFIHWQNHFILNLKIIKNKNYFKIKIKTIK